MSPETSQQHLPPYRYGTEYEGSYYGCKTLILPSSIDHNLDTVERLRQQHGNAPVDHLWIEVQPGEVFNWGGVKQLLGAGYRISVQVRTEADLPEPGLEWSGICIVWMAPPEFHKVLAACGWIKVVHGPGAFDGFEIHANTRHKFPSEKYITEDEVWPRL